MLAQSDLLKTLSNSSSLLGATNLADSIKHLPSWEAWPQVSLVGCAALLVLRLVARLVVRSRAKISNDADDAPTRIIAVDPTLAGREIYLDPLFERKTRQGKEDTQLSARLIAFLQRI